MKRMMSVIVVMILTLHMGCADPASTNATPVSLTPSTQSEDWTIAGKTYHNVVVGNVYADRVEITYDGGVGTPLLKDLSPELQKRFNYDPEAAKKAEAKRDADQQATQRQYAVIDTARANERAKEDEATRLANRPKVYLMGEVLSKIPGGGLLVNCEMPEPVVDSSASIGGGGNVYVPQTGCPAGVKQVYGTFRLTGYPNEASLVDGAAIKTVALENGTYSYTSVAGAYKTVASYATVQLGN